jgi:hypothetical protein
MIFAKLEFSDKAQADKALALVSGSIAHLGNIQLQAGEYEFKDGKLICVKEPILSTKWHVDVLLDAMPISLSKYEVFIQGTGMHTFAGCEQLYIDRYKKYKK